MTFFDNKNAESPIAALECADYHGQRLVFLHTKPRTEAEKITDWVANSGLKLQEIARTLVDGHEVVIAQTETDSAKILATLQTKGEQFAEAQVKKGISPWKLRGWASFIGQPLQIFSGLLQKGTIDPATIGFGSFNMLANITNIVFGAETKKDPNREHYIKEEINRDLDEHLPGHRALLSPDDKRTDRRGDAEKATDSNDGWYGFMRRNSVRIGEIGLRYIGAISLAFPLLKITKSMQGKPLWTAEALKEGTAHWGKGFNQLRQGDAGKAFETLANADKFTRGAGIAYLVGKTIAFGSEVPDPYDTKPRSSLDTVREKFLFPASSMIEAVAAGLIAYNGLFNRRLSWPENKWYVPKVMQGKNTRDYLGGIGGMLFTAGLIIRIFAPFGKREVDMDDITAHITDTLVKTPRSEMPRLLADSAATVFEHTRDKGASYGTIFTSMAQDLEQYHHIALNTPQESSGNVLTAEKNAPQVTQPTISAPPTLAATEEPRPLMNRVAAPSVSHAAQAAQQREQSAQQTLQLA